MIQLQMQYQQQGQNLKELQDNQFRFIKYFSPTFLLLFYLLLKKKTQLN